MTDFLLAAIIVWSPKAEATFASTDRPILRMPSITASASPFEVTRKVATWTAGNNYETLLYWQEGGPTSAVFHAISPCSLYFTNLEVRVFAMVTNDYGRSNIAFDPQYPADRFYITCPTELNFSLESSADMRNWQFYTNAIVYTIVRCTEKSRFFRAPGKPLIQIPYNPMNE
jgi:hypothetical protein